MLAEETMSRPPPTQLSFPLHVVLDTNVVLDSFILSNTPYQQVSWWNGSMTLADFESRHVLFTKPNRNIYIGKMLHEILRHN